MKTVKCSDLGMKGCGYAALGKTDADVKKALTEHGKKDHKDQLAKMTPAQMKEVETKINALLAKQKSSM